MTGIQFRPNFYIVQNTTAPEPVKLPEKSTLDQKIEEKTYVEIKKNILALKADPLLKQVEYLKIDIPVDVANVIKLDDRSSGYPQLFIGLLLICYQENHIQNGAADQKFRQIKLTRQGPISAKEIAQKFSEILGKKRIWFVRDLELYESEKTQEKLKAIILKIWNTKNGGEPVKDFKDLLEK